MPDTVDRAAPKAKRSQMTIFRHGDRKEMDHEIMPFEGMDDSVKAGFAKLAEGGANRARGDEASMLFTVPGDPGLSLAHAWFKSGYVLPRHSHNADCIYYILGGSIKLGTQKLGKGDGFFVPKDHGYSYVVGDEGAEVLEFRNAAHFHILFKGNDEAHWSRMADALNAGGKKWADEKAPFSEPA